MGLLQLFKELREELQKPLPPEEIRKMNRTGPHRRCPKCHWLGMTVRDVCPKCGERLI